MWWILTSLTAALIVLVDVLQSFDLVINTKTRNSAWILLMGFVGVNALFAIVLHFQFFDNEALKAFSPWTKSILIGMAYVALVHVKLATIKIDNKEIPLGLEYIYETLKQYIYKQINREIIQAKYREAVMKSRGKSLKELATEARMSIGMNNMLNEQEKKEHKQWLLNVLQEPSPDERQKKVLIAHFINYGERISND